MKRTKEGHRGLVAVLTTTILSTLMLASLAAGPPAIAARQIETGAQDSTVKDKTVVAFEQRVKEYVRLREGIEEKMPKLSKEATPEEIQAHKEKFKENVRAARAGAKQGSFFTPDAAEFIRTTIRNEFKGKERQELLSTIMEADTKGVPLRVNYPYPEAKEMVEMPPTLLLQFPQLPKQVRYRFVGRNMLLVDRENGLIIDYMTNAIP